ncbi:MAG: hypothetical protein RLZZ628_383 [Bacteroidota bacterium]|jgi:hypothetical protein
MNDDGREISLDDMVGRNIVFRYIKPVQVCKRKGYFPEKSEIVTPLKDIGVYNGIYIDARNEKKALELVQGDLVFYIYFEDNNNSDLDTEYIRKQYFKQETDSQGWFGGVWDGNITDLPNKLAKKISDAAGVNIENVKTGLKTAGVIVIGSVIGLGYLYYRMHQTNVNVNIN